ncbi:hypothetical protein Barb4_03961 [Bacteroidales bacterium Barb4]|nr:hypothetical protein Barb4_03961 [Bacteroidales bacterium Barb4]
MANEKERKKGVTSFGYVANIRTFIQEANSLLAENEVPIRAFEFNTLIDKIIEDQTVIYKNKFGGKYYSR